MSDLPKAGSRQAAPTRAEGDWRETLVRTAQRAGGQVQVRERARNPMLPDNFMDLSEAGFPADISVVPVQIPRQAVPAEMAQYRDLVNRQWLHLPWDVISSNGGMDGKANLPGAMPLDMGGGHLVATLAGHYLMYADKAQYHSRRAENRKRSTESVQYKMEPREEGEHRRDATNTGPMSIEELFEYERSIGEEAALKGQRIER